MKCIDKACEKNTAMGCSGLCRKHYEEMLEEQRENTPEVFNENISW